MREEGAREACRAIPPRHECRGLSRRWNKVAKSGSPRLWGTGGGCQCRISGKISQCPADRIDHRRDSHAAHDGGNTLPVLCGKGDRQPTMRLPPFERGNIAAVWGALGRIRRPAAPFRVRYHGHTIGERGFGVKRLSSAEIFLLTSIKTRYTILAEVEDGQA